MKINTTFGYWVKVAPLAGFKMQTFTRPAFIGKKATPTTLNELTIGQLIELSQLKDTTESMYNVVEIVMDVGRKEIEKARAVDVVRFIGWVHGEVDKINKLFDKVGGSKPTEKEKKAGIDKLRFGLFGMLDWYALRMRIQDHDTVLAVPWMRIYKCMDMDNKKQKYERNLQRIAAEEMSQRARRRR